MTINSNTVGDDFLVFIVLKVQKFASVI